MEGLISLISLVVLLLLGLIVGRARERSHFRNLDERERQLEYMLLTDIKTFPGGADGTRGGTLVMGQAVIATDYLKTFFAGFRKIIGGEMRSFESLMERARREAILRMLEEARDKGFNAVCNLRMGTADIGGVTGARGAVMVEAFATGTAYCIPE